MRWGRALTMFPGFPRQLPEFMSALAGNNSKPWFDAHRDDYERHYLGAATDFIQALGPRLGDVAPALSAEPKINRSIRRINRDTRFAKDKTPYKTQLHLTFWLGASRIACQISGSTLARPRRFPFALARVSPAVIRSRMMDRSNSANTPHMRNIALPAGVVVSIPCWRKYRSMPSAWSCSRNSRRC